MPTILGHSPTGRVEMERPRNTGQNHVQRIQVQPCRIQQRRPQRGLQRPCSDKWVLDTLAQGTRRPEPS